MACKEDHYRLLPDEDEYPQPQSFLHKRCAFFLSILLALSMILNAVLFFSRDTPLVAVPRQDRSEYGPLLTQSPQFTMCRSDFPAQQI